MINFSALSKISTRNVWRNKKRSFLTLGAIAVGVLSSSMLSALQAGARAQIEEDSVHNLLGHIKIAHSDYFDDQVALNSILPFEVVYFLYTSLSLPLVHSPHSQLAQDCI